MNKNKQINRARAKRGYRIHPTLGTIIDKIVISRKNVSVINGSANVTFSGLAYVNLGDDLVAQTDFTDISPEYDLCKLVGLQITVRRVANDTTLGSLGIPDFPVYINLYPGRLSFSSASSVVRSETALVTNPLSLEASTKYYPIVPYIGYSTSGGIDYTVNSAEWLTPSLMQRISGCFTVGWDNSTAAIASATVYSMEIRYFMKFACPL